MVNRKARRNRINWGGKITRRRKGRDSTFANTCGKVRFTNAAAAETAAAGQTDRHGVATRCYRCRTCHGWHLTTQPRRS